MESATDFVSYPNLLNPKTEWGWLHDTVNVVSAT